jgi:hypothetical protein
MTDKSGLHGVYVDEGRVDDFLTDIYGSNRKSNKRALESGAMILAAAGAYHLYRTAHPKKKKRKGRR